MLLIYSPHITSRLSYVCEFIFSRVIPCDYKLSSGIAEFSGYQGPKINYSGNKSTAAFDIHNSSLLFETDVKQSQLEGLELFPASKEELPRDVFASVFFMISRYEEWLPYTPDRHGRFEAANSILWKHHCLDVPVVDQWCYRLKDLLLQQFPSLQFRQRRFSYLSTIDVDNDYAYLGKPLYRTIGASVKDLLKGNMKQWKQRLAVISGKAPDPFENCEFQTALSIAHRSPLLYFFLTLERQSAYDRAVPFANPLFEAMLKKIKHKAQAGLHPSYFSAEQKMIAKEKRQLEQLLGQPVNKSRQHYLHFDIKTTPQQLIAAGIAEDHSMGFASHYGFRAGTCTPFRYFDFHQNEAATLEMVPFCVMDSVYYDYLKKPVGEAERLMLQEMQQVRAVDGTFVSVWHDRSFSELHYPGWRALYEKLQVILGDQ